MDLEKSVLAPRFAGGGGFNVDQANRHTAFLAAISKRDSLQELNEVKERYMRFKCHLVESAPLVAVGVEE